MEVYHCGKYSWHIQGNVGGENGTNWILNKKLKLDDYTVKESC